MRRKAFGLLIVFGTLIPFSLMVAGFFARNAAQAVLVKRHVSSIYSFWAAEQGVLRAEQDLRDCALNNACTVTGTVSYDTDSYEYDARIRQLSERYYRIDSTGSGDEVMRSVSSVVQLRDIDPGRFENGVEAQGDIELGGSAQVNPAESVKAFSSLDFEVLFGFTKEEVKAYADNVYVDPPNNVQPCDGITWIEVSDTDKFRITNTNWHGSGILVIDGDVSIDLETTITGGKFDGIIYVVGNMEVPAGNPVFTGAVLVENDTTDTTRLRGDMTVNYSLEEIADALELLRFHSPEKVAWWENTM